MKRVVNMFSGHHIVAGRYPARRSGYNVVALVPWAQGEVVVGRTNSAAKWSTWLVVSDSGSAYVEGRRSRAVAL